MTNFDLNKEIDDYECSVMFKNGLKHYISSNNLKINSEKEFEKAVKDFEKLKIGD